MKKLLVLTLVLGMASLASADETIVAPDTVNIGETVTVAVNSTEGGIEGIWRLEFSLDTVLQGQYTLGTPVVTANAGNNSSTVGPVESNDYLVTELTVSDTISVDNILAGDWMTITMTGVAAGDVEVLLYQKFGESLALQDSITMEVGHRRQITDTCDNFHCD